MKKRATSPREIGKQDRAALLVIDVQKELFDKATPIYQADELIENINALVARAHKGGIPVIYVQHSSKNILIEGSDGWKLHPGLKPRREDLIVHKHHGDAFEDTCLSQELESRHITQLVITGLVTHGCVRATCLVAHKLGYRVVLVKDGHSSYHKYAARLIEEWNQKLSDGIAEVKAAREVDFLS